MVELTEDQKNFKNQLDCSETQGKIAYDYWKTDSKKKILFAVFERMASY
jgi:hypothetical protein